MQVQHQKRRTRWTHREWADAFGYGQLAGAVEALYELRKDRETTRFVVSELFVRDTKDAAAENQLEALLVEFYDQEDHTTGDLFIWIDDPDGPVGDDQAEFVEELVGEELEWIGVGEGVVFDLRRDDAQDYVEVLRQQGIPAEFVGECTSVAEVA